MKLRVKCDIRINGKEMDQLISALENKSLRSDEDIYLLIKYKEMRDRIHKIMSIKEETTID